MRNALVAVARRTMVGAVAGLLVLMALTPAVAQERLRVDTPYPAVAVEAGETHRLPLTIHGPDGARADLEVAEVPEGWTATLRGGGFVVDGVTLDADAPPEVTLEVAVPPGAGEGTHRVVVTASGAGAEASLPVDLRVAEAAAGSVTLTSEFPALRGSADTAFSYSLTLENATPAETTFSLETAGPPGWIVEARPAGQQRAATITVGPGESSNISVDVEPPPDATAGTYEVAVRAVGGGDSAVATLEVEITGSVAMTLTTPDERLNATLQAGRASEVELVVRNDGSAPLLGVDLTATAPTGWETSFGPRAVDAIAPGESATVTATVTPTSEAVAGDYVVTFRANAEGASDSVEIRATVETSRLWGVVGLGLIVLTFVGLGMVFQRYGRR